MYACLSACCVHMCVCVCSFVSGHVYGGQRTTLCNQVFLSIFTGVSGITCRAILLDPKQASKLGVGLFWIVGAALALLMCLVDTLGLC